MKPGKSALRFALPPSLGGDVGAKAAQLGAWLHEAVGRDFEVVPSTSYEQLSRDLLGGRADAAWAPPFVCARIEAMGIRVLVRGVRNGASTYRAALLCRRGAGLAVDTLAGSRAAWCDRDSVGGYLLAMAWLREHDVDPAHAFAHQDFVGGYRAALEAVASGAADVTSIFAHPDAPEAGGKLGVEEVWPGHGGDFDTITWTNEAPNDGVAVSLSLSATVVAGLEKALLGLHQTKEGQAVLRDCFHAERFEASPRMGYRALYRVALASL